MKHRNSLPSIAALAIAYSLSAGQAAGQAWVASASGQFGQSDPATGHFTLIGHTREVLSGLATGPKNGIYGLDADNNLITVDPQTSATAVVGSIGLPVAPNGNVTLFTSVGNGKLFALDPFNQLYSINPSTGHATLIAYTGVPTPNFDTCNCVTANSLAGGEGYLYFTFEVDDLASGKATTPSALFRIDTYSGVATQVGATHADAPIVGSGFINGRLYGFTFGQPVNQPNKVVDIDIETAVATFVAYQAPNFTLDVIFGATSVLRPVCK